jgi:hypothetical protein
VVGLAIVSLVALGSVGIAPALVDWLARRLETIRS